jgi:calcium-dependent protein kinase
MNQINELKQVFLKFDESGDGQLQLEEIEAGLKEVLGSVKGKMKIYDQTMGALDKNCNGVIDYSEFLVAASNKELLLSTENLKLAFSMFDKDKNGTISRPELRAVFEANETKDD